MSEITPESKHRICMARLGLARNILDMQILSQHKTEKEIEEITYKWIDDEIKSLDFMGYLGILDYYLILIERQNNFL